MESILRVEASFKSKLTFFLMGDKELKLSDTGIDLGSEFTFIDEVKGLEFLKMLEGETGPAAVKYEEYIATHCDLE